MTTKKRYTFALKNVKYAEFNSQETHCFEATLYVNGQRFCTVSDEGHGGCMNFHSIGPMKYNELMSKIREIDAELGKEKVFSRFFEDGLKNNLEFEVNRLVTEWLQSRDIKKMLRRICYIKGGDTKAIYQLAAKYKPLPENLKLVKTAKWWGSDWRLLNEMSVEEILKLDAFAEAA